MGCYKKARANLTNNQLKELKYPAKNKTGKTRITKKELSR